MSKLLSAAIIILRYLKYSLSFQSCSCRWFHFGSIELFVFVSFLFFSFISYASYLFSTFSASSIVLFVYFPIRSISSTKASLRLVYCLRIVRHSVQLDIQNVYLRKIVRNFLLSYQFTQKSCK